MQTNVLTEDVHLYILMTFYFTRDYLIGYITLFFIILYSVEWLTISHIYLMRFGIRLYQAYKNQHVICVSLKKILILEIIFVEAQQRDHICRGSEQLYNSCKESADYICIGSFEDYSEQKRMIIVKGKKLLL